MSGMVRLRERAINAATAVGWGMQLHGQSPRRRPLKTGTWCARSHERRPEPVPSMDSLGPGEAIDTVTAVRTQRGSTGMMGPSRGMGVQGGHRARRRPAPSRRTPVHRPTARTSMTRRCLETVTSTRATRVPSRATRRTSVAVKLGVAALLLAGCAAAPGPVATDTDSSVSQPTTAEPSTGDPWSRAHPPSRSVRSPRWSSPARTTVLRHRSIRPSTSQPGRATPRARSRLSTSSTSRV